MRPLRAIVGAAFMPPLPQMGNGRVNNQGRMNTPGAHECAPYGQL